MSGRTRLILAVLGVLVVLAGFYFLLIRPRQGELDTVNQEIQTEQDRTTQLQTELARLQDLQANAPQLQAELAKIRGYVPQDDEVPNFIFLVQDAANAAGVDFVQITPELPKPPPEGAALAEIRAQIGAGGGYFAVQDFIRRLHALDRAIRLDNIALTGTEDTTTGEVTIDLTSAARIFFEVPGASAGTTAQPVPSPATTP